MVLKPEDLHSKARSAASRLAELDAISGELPPEHRKLFEDSLEEFSTILKALDASAEQLRQADNDVAEAEKHLEAARHRYRELLQFAISGYVVTDEEGIILDANPAAEELLNTPRESLLGRHIVHYVDGRYRETFRSRLRSACDQDAVATAEWQTRLWPYRGEGFPATVTVSRLKAVEAYDEARLGWMLRDTSESQRLMEENQRRQLFLERLMDAAPVGIAVVRGDDYRYDMANVYYRDIPGAKCPLLGRTFEEVRGEASTVHGTDALDRVRQTGEPVRLRERRVVRETDGPQTYWNVDLVPLQDPDGSVGGVLILAREVTQDVQARREIERLADVLQQERDKLKTIMENTHANLAYLDPSFDFVHVNTAYAEGAGYTTEELIGQNHFDLFPDPENEAIFEQVKETGEPVSYRGKPFVYADQPERGVTYWDWTLVPVKDEDGDVEGLVFSLLNVTERERLIQQVNSEQARLRAIIRNTPEGIVVVNDQAQITLTNPAADEMYARHVPYGEGYSSHADLCLCYPDGTAVPPRDLPLTRAALDGETQKDLELSLIRPEGEKRDLLVSTALIHRGDDDVAGAVGLFRDITERKRIEQAVRQYAERLRVLHELDQAILTTHSAEEIAGVALSRLRLLVQCQRASVELFDPEAQETSLLGVETDGDTKLPTGKRRPINWHGALPALQEGQPHVIEDLSRIPASPWTETLRQEGVSSLVSLPLRTRDELTGALNVAMGTTGRPSASQMATMREVAQQLSIGIHHAWLHKELHTYADRLEHRVELRTAQLEASEARFRAIFEQTALGIALLDQGGRIMASNEALRDMLSRSREDLQGQRLTDFAHPDEDVAEDVVAFREMREGDLDHHRVEIRYGGPGEEMGWANMVLSLVRDSQDNPQFIIAMVEDITERKRAQEALIQSEKLATTGRLAASLAHEINNPLQTVLGCLGLAEEAMEEDDDEVETYVAMAHEELKRAAKIVSRLRDLSRPSDSETGQPTDVNSLVDDVLKVSRKDLKNNQIRVQRRLQEDLPKPVLMPDRMKQVFLNLVLNARDAMSGGGELTVATAYDATDDEVIVSFRDQGPGIPSEIRDRLFDPFFSTKSDGTGLGLFVSRNIVQEQDGRIDVQSTVGHGSTFKVCLPASRS